MQQQNMAAKNTLFTLMLTSLTDLTRAHRPTGSHQHTNPEFSTSEDPRITEQLLLLLQQQLNLKYHHKTHESRVPVANVWLFHQDYRVRLTLAPSFHQVSAGLWASIFVFPRSPSAGPLRPRPRMWGLFINKRPLFHTQLDACWRAREGPTMSSTMPQWAAMTTRTKPFCSVPGFHIQKQLPTEEE